MERIINNKGATSTGRTFIINNQRLFISCSYHLNATAQSRCQFVRIVMNETHHHHVQMVVLLLLLLC